MSLVKQANHERKRKGSNQKKMGQGQEVGATTRFIEVLLLQPPRTLEETSGGRGVAGGRD